MKAITVSQGKKLNTPQKVFNYVANHLVSMDGPSTAVDGMCSYRGYGDRMCPVGCLIPDESYSIAMEGQVAASGSVIRGLAIKTDAHTMKLIGALQFAHDSVCFSYSFRGSLSETACWQLYIKDELNKIADNFGLSTRWIKA